MRRVLSRPTSIVDTGFELSGTIPILSRTIREEIEPAVIVGYKTLLFGVRMTFSARLSKRILPVSHTIPPRNLVSATRPAPSPLGGMFQLTSNAVKHSITA